MPMPSTDNPSKTSILKSTREAKGLTLEIVHETTKIPMDVLRAIEEGYSVRILTPFYYRGFIKIYAEFLGLNVAETYKHYNLDVPATPTTPSSFATSSVRQKPSLPSNPILEQAGEGLAFIFNPKNTKRILKFIGVLLIVFLGFKLCGYVISHIFSHKKQPTSYHTVNLKPSRFYTSQEERASVASVVSPQAMKQQTIRLQSQNNKVIVAVRAIRDTWIQVKADDKVVFQMTLSKGAMESWTADDRIELAGRNISQLDMEVNGRHIGTLASSGRRIRRVLITPQGLTVKR